MPSAVRIAARRSRSARICFSIASWIDPRRIDRLDLDAVDADAPLAGRLVEHAAQLRVDVVAAGQRLSSVSQPITLRSVVTVICSIACNGLAIS